jgi:transposase
MASKRPQTTKSTQAAKAVEKLRKMGLSYEQIAVGVAVSVNTIIRWKKGVEPQPGHFTALLSFLVAQRAAKAK